MKQLLIATTALVFLSACGKEETPPPPMQTAPGSSGARPEKMPNGQPGVIVVKHVLVAFAGSERSSQKRSKADAQKLAYEILGRAKSGEDFDKLVNEYSDDSGKQAYTMTNHGIEATPDVEFNRGDMATSFGDVGFRISVDEIGIAEYDPVNSRFGWHIIKRVK